jgi:hypothetical protein
MNEKVLILKWKPSSMHAHICKDKFSQIVMLKEEM